MTHSYNQRKKEVRKYKTVKPDQVQNLLREPEPKSKVAKILRQFLIDTYGKEEANA